MRTPDQIIQECLDIIEKSDKTQSIDQLIILNDRLSTQNVFLSEMLSMCQRDHLYGKYERKKAITHAFLIEKKEGRSDKLALETAQEEQCQLIENEIEKETLKRRLENFCGSVRLKIESIRSKISYWKAEKQREMPGQL